MEAMVRKLRMVTEDGSDCWWLTDRDYYDQEREPLPEDVTAEALAHLMDHNAEQCNAHDFVCAHRGLAQILAQEVGREAATRILRRLVNYEGLHGLVGVCGTGDVAAAERELGCSLHDWSEWSLANAEHHARHGAP